MVAISVSVDQNCAVAQNPLRFSLNRFDTIWPCGYGRFSFKSPFVSMDGGIHLGPFKGYGPSPARLEHTTSSTLGGLR